MNVLVTRHDKIGDFCTALPMLKVLKEKSNHKVFALVSKVNYEFAKNFDFIDDVMLFDPNPFVLAKKIKRKKIDVSISAFIDTRLGAALFLSGIKTRIAPATKLAQIFFNKRIVQRRSEVKKSEWEFNLDLLKKFDRALDIKFKPPIVNFGYKRENIVVFHPGFGGSSDGNLKVEDYLRLANSIKDKTKVVFTFGPADEIYKKYIKENSDFLIKDDFRSLWEFTKYLAKVKLIVSTSTGPMHLGAISNTPTFSFFGDTKFASFKRWKPASDESLQHNFLVKKDYDEEFFLKIKNRLHEVIEKKS